MTHSPEISASVSVASAHPQQKQIQAQIDMLDDDLVVDIIGPTDDECPFCKAPLRRCPSIYDGQTKKSMNGQLYAFAWKKNSCPFDSVLSVHLMLWHNMNDAGQTVYMAQHPILADLFIRLINGTVYTHAAKKEVDKYFGERLWRGQNSLRYMSFINHRVGTTHAVTQLMQLDTEAKKGAVPLEGDVRSLSLAKARRIFRCLVCDTDHVDTEDIHTNALEGLIDKPLHPRWLDTAFEEADTSSKQKYACTTCGRWYDMFHEAFHGPIILQVNTGPLLETKFSGPRSHTIPEHLTYGNTEYVLIGIIYGGTGHFVSLTRNVRLNQMFSNDGMDDHAAYVKYTKNKFPNKYGQARLDTAFYLHPDYIRTL